MGKPHLHVMGDSHCQVFEYMRGNSRVYPLEVDIDCCIVQGATNMGLANPHSKTQAMPIFKEHLKKVKRHDYVVLMLGEVDCGFVIWYRAQKYNMSIESQFETSVENYLRLIDNILLTATKRVIVVSTPLPTIPDSQVTPVGEVANKRLEVKASLSERTSLTRRYNLRLKEACMQRNIVYLDCEKDILDPQTNTVRTKFLNEDPADHHLSSKEFANILAPKMEWAMNKLKKDN